jgi:hypothetical protein
MDKEESAGIVRNANRLLSPTIGRGFFTWRLSTTLCAMKPICPPSADCLAISSSIIDENKAGHSLDPYALAELYTTLVPFLWLLGTGTYVHGKIGQPMITIPPV